MHTLTGTHESHCTGVLTKAIELAKPLLELLAAGRAAERSIADADEREAMRASMGEQQQPADGDEPPPAADAEPTLDRDQAHAQVANTWSNTCSNT